VPLVRIYWILKINLPQILLGALIGAVFSTIVTILTVPYFSATAQIFVSTPATSLDIVGLAQGSNFSQQRVKSYAKIMSSPLTIEPVIKKLGISNSYTDIAERLNASVPLDTVLIDISYKDRDPVKAANVINAIGLQFSETASTIEFGDSAQGIKVTLVKYATPPKKPSTPKAGVNFGIGTLLGGILGLILRIIVAIFDTSIKNEKQLDGKKLFGAIIFDRRAHKYPLIASASKYSPRAESFRQLRTNLIHSRFSDESELQVVLMASSLPGEGKSTTCLNLAYCFSEANYRTIVIEADLRRPTLHKYFSELDRKVGLSGILDTANKELNRRKFNKCIQRPKGQGFDIMLAGKLPETPAELLENGQFQLLISELRKGYDKIIVDSPPLLPVTDAAILAPFCDGVLVVVKAGSTKQAQLRAAYNSLQSVSARILGVVFNMIPVGTRDYVNYGYEHGYVSPYFNNKKIYDSEYGSVYGTNAYYERIQGEAPYAPDIEDLKEILDRTSQISKKT
jgi:succinoglycan biosynthesis transport protein ExoP